MNRGTVVDAIFVLVVNISAMATMYLSGELLPRVGDHMKDIGDNIGIYGGVGFINDSQSIIFLWVPLIAIGGSWAIFFWREYRRQRVENPRAVRRRV